MDQAWKSINAFIVSFTFSFRSVKGGGGVRKKLKLKGGGVRKKYV